MISKTDILPILNHFLLYLLSLHFPLFSLFSWIEVDKILDVRDEDVTEVVDEHPPPVTAGKSQKIQILDIKRNKIELKESKFRFEFKFKS